MYNEDDAEKPGIPPNFIPALLKYKWYIVLTSLPMLVVTAVVVASLPPVFQSGGTVMVETQQIPEDLVQTTVTTAAKERIEIIKQRVMTREKMLSIIRKYDYFQLDENSPVQIGQVIDSVRRSISVNVISTKGPSRGSSRAIAFSVAFDSRSPSIAHAMANDLITLFLSENVKVRTQRASETTEFLKREAAKVKSELDKIELSVAEFKQKNKDSLPEHLSLYGDMRAQAREELDSINRNIRAAQEQIDILNAQLALAEEGSGTVSGVNIEPSARLKELREQYKQLSLRYKPNYPDLVELREQIALLESQPPAAATGDGEDATSYASSGELAVSKQIRLLKDEIKLLQQDKREREETIADLERRILNIPLVERGLVDLNRGYKTRLDRYEAITAKIMDASMAESLEQSLQAEKFSVIEPPIMPRVPVAPDRMKLMGMGGAAAFSLPIGLVLLIGFLDKTVRSPKVLGVLVNNRQIVEVPYIASENESRGARRRVRLSFVIAVGVGLLAVLFLHFFYMPIDQIFEKVLERFGIYIF